MSTAALEGNARSSRWLRGARAISMTPAWIMVLPFVVVGLLILTLIYNLNEASVLFPNDFSSTLSIVACCGLAQRAREIKMAEGTQESLYN